MDLVVGSVFRRWRLKFKLNQNRQEQLLDSAINSLANGGVVLPHEGGKFWLTKDACSAETLLRLLGLRKAKRPLDKGEL